MTDRYRPRTLSTALLRHAEQFPAVVVTGPRQSGKTTLVRHHFGTSHRYVSLDTPGIRELAVEDPNLFLEQYGPPAILDEIQYAPELLHAVKRDIDEHRDRPGRYIITGSQVFPLMAGVTESLAGRASVLFLQSLSPRELCGVDDGELDAFALARDLASREVPRDLRTAREVAQRMIVGGFPEPALSRRVDPAAWHAAYIRTYLERDVRAVRAVGSLAEFERFLFALAAHSPGPLNGSDLGRDLGVSHHTVREWLSVLETSGQCGRLLPYFVNLGKRLVKRPRLYFHDTGTLSTLLRVRDVDQALEGPAAGVLFESAVYGALHRLFAHRGESAPLYFWRTSGGHEVDFVLDLGDTLVPIEAKRTSTPRRAHGEGIERFQDLFGERAGHGYVVCLVPGAIPLSRSVTAISFGAL